MEKYHQRWLERNKNSYCMERKKIRSLKCNKKLPISFEYIKKQPLSERNEKTGVI